MSKIEYENPYINKAIAEGLVNSGVLYDSDDAFTEGYKRAADVLAYEVFKLENFDALHFMFRNYDLPREIRRKWCGYIRELLENGYVEDMSMDELVDEAREILDAVEKSTCKKINYMLWLTDIADAKQLARSSGGNMVGHDVSGAVILSEYKDEGKLYGFAEDPLPISA